MQRLAGEAGEREYCSQRQRAGEARGVVNGQHPAEQFCQQRAQPEEKRTVIDIGFSGKPRHQPAAFGHELVNDADPDGIVNLPGGVADQTGQGVRERKYRDQYAGQGQRHGAHYSITFSNWPGRGSPVG